MTQNAHQPTNAAIKEILVERIDRQRYGVGIVVGVIDRYSRRVVAHGRYKSGGTGRVGGDTLFEIGSITKVFTSLLLSDMSLRGEVALDDPVAKHLPEGVVMPERAGRRITLADLATHTSGLPPMPTNFKPVDWNNFFTGYSTELLYAFLSHHVLTRDIGAEYEYSNVGVGLLGHVLARRLGTDYESLLKARIASPLGLGDTAIQLSHDQQKRFAHGHDADGHPVPNLEDPESFAGAGALRSTADDLVTFLAVSLGYEDAPLKRAIDAQFAYPMRKTGQEGFSQGLGWRDTEDEFGRVVWHGGTTWGYRTFIGLNPARGLGAVVLTNTSGERGGDDIGRHILTGAPLASPPKRRRAISVEPAILDRYVGRYRFEFASEMSWIEIERWNGWDAGLIAKVDGMGEARIFASSPTTFFWRTVDAELSFETDADGAALALTTRSRAGGENRALRA